MESGDALPNAFVALAKALNRLPTAAQAAERISHCMNVEEERHRIAILLPDSSMASALFSHIPSGHFELASLTWARERLAAGHPVDEVIRSLQDHIPLLPLRSLSAQEFEVVEAALHALAPRR